MSRELTIWTITTGTKDYGPKFVARPHHIVSGGIILGAECLVADNLDQVRALLPPGLDCIGRQDDDEPVIVESWL